MKHELLVTLTNNVADLSELPEWLNLDGFQHHLAMCDSYLSTIYVKLFQDKVEDQVAVLIYSYMTLILYSYNRFDNEQDYGFFLQNAQAVVSHYFDYFPHKYMLTIGDHEDGKRIDPVMVKDLELAIAIFNEFGVVVLQSSWNHQYVSRFGKHDRDESMQVALLAEQPELVNAPERLYEAFSWRHKIKQLIGNLQNYFEQAGVNPKAAIPLITNNVLWVDDSSEGLTLNDQHELYFRKLAERYFEYADFIITLCVIARRDNASQALRIIGNKNTLFLNQLLEDSSIRLIGKLLRDYLLNNSIRSEVEDDTVLKAVHFLSRIDANNTDSDKFITIFSALRQLAYAQPASFNELFDVIIESIEQRYKVPHSEIGNYLYYFHQLAITLPTVNAVDLYPMFVSAIRIENERNLKREERLSKDDVFIATCKSFHLYGSLANPINYVILLLNQSFEYPVNFDWEKLIEELLVSIDFTSEGKVELIKKFAFYYLENRHLTYEFAISGIKTIIKQVSSNYDLFTDFEDDLADEAFTLRIWEYRDLVFKFTNDFNQPIKIHELLQYLESFDDLEGLTAMLDSYTSYSLVDLTNLKGLQKISTKIYKDSMVSLFKLTTRGSEIDLGALTPIKKADYSAFTVLANYLIDAIGEDQSELVIRLLAHVYTVQPKDSKPKFLFELALILSKHHDYLKNTDFLEILSLLNNSITNCESDKQHEITKSVLQELSQTLALNLLIVSLREVTPPTEDETAVRAVIARIANLQLIPIPDSYPELMNLELSNILNSLLGRNFTPEQARSAIAKVNLPSTVRYLTRYLRQYQLPRVELVAKFFDALASNTYKAVRYKPLRRLNIPNLENWVSDYQSEIGTITIESNTGKLLNELRNFLLNLLNDQHFQQSGNPELEKLQIELDSYYSDNSESHDLTSEGALLFKELVETNRKTISANEFEMTRFLNLITEFTNILQTSGLKTDAANLKRLTKGFKNNVGTILTNVVFTITDSPEVITSIGDLPVATCQQSISDELADLELVAESLMDPLCKVALIYAEGKIIARAKVYLGQTDSDEEVVWGILMDRIYASFGATDLAKVLQKEFLNFCIENEFAASLPTPASTEFRLPQLDKNIDRYLDADTEQTEEGTTIVTDAYLAG